MTAKVKAKALVNEFYKCMPFKDTKLTACDEKPELIIEMEELSAKQCALIAVDQILFTLGEPTYFIETRRFWKQVKEEINNLT